ncbi:MarR family winged helix-turn-helix transcriptional regulator [Microbacterium sp.]|uniref:MarR family winged helix-turn-helix transcriptional regulator n=1 Tax=Microbacterium sp. TaxID=51671 RepID=UPI003A893981
MEKDHGEHEHLNALLVEFMRQGDQVVTSLPVGERLSLTETLLLHHVDHEGPRSQQELADLVRVDKSTASRLVASLVERGAVERDRDPGNRRVVMVTITEQGRRLHRDMAQALSQRTCGVFDAMSDQDRAALATGLEALLAALRTAPGDG